MRDAGSPAGETPLPEVAPGTPTTRWPPVAIRHARAMPARGNSAMMAQMLRIRLLYGGTIFCSSLLLFLVQPVMAKAMLPSFGGSAGVWTSAMLFFQAVLLLGYFFAHWTTEHLAPRSQAVLFLLLLAASVLTIPVGPPAAAKTVAAGEPIARILFLLARSVGLPFLLLSATGPLAQAWFTRRAKAALPYRLFAVSNVASLAGLMAYPLVIEPLTSIRQQLMAWSAAYAGFALLAGAAGLLGGSGFRLDTAPAESPRMAERLLWAALAACPAILWLGTANVLSQYIAPIPFLWMLPLSIYLLSFILCFGRESWYQPAVYRVALPAAWVLMWYCLAHSTIGLKRSILLFSAALFVCSMFCHGELARRKPAAGRLTGFYLMLALGGALGGCFVALAAPNLFSGFLELPAGVAVSIILGLGLLYGIRPRHLARLGILAVLAFAIAIRIGGYAAGDRVRVRNFYGSLRVSDMGTGDMAVRILSNGSVHHGTQFLSPDKSRLATSYYGPDSGAGLAIRLLQKRSERVGVIGLGAGTLASYARAGDSYRFYEINPAVIQLANTEFRYLRECPGRVETVLGDGRLALEREPGQIFDVLAVDAFSGDSIPVHLLTREAFGLYFSHLRADGVLAVHVTNKYLDLAAAVQKLADHFGRPARLVRNPADPAAGVYQSSWVLITANEEILQRAGGLPMLDSTSRRVRLWTDDYSNPFQMLR